jgi:tetratricopeptide (TPR) repeat protein
VEPAKDAVAAHREAVAFFELLVSKQAEVSEHRRELALAHNNLATALARSGATEEARTEYVAAIALQDELIASGDAPSADEYQQYRLDLAVTHTNLGLLYRDRNESAAAQRELSEAVRIQETLLGRTSKDDEIARNLAGAYNNLGSLYLDAEPRRAKSYFASALDLRERMTAESKEDLRFQQELALSYNNLAAVSARLGEFDTAVEAYAEAIKRQEQLARAAPDQKNRQRELAKTINNLGLAQGRLNRTQEAEASFRRALHVLHLLKRRWPKDPETVSALGGTYNNLGIVCEATKRPKEAAVAYQQAIKHQRDAFTVAPTVELYRELLIKHLFNYGRMERKSGELDRAVEAAAERRGLVENDPRRLLSVAEEFAVAYERLLARDDDKSAAPAVETTPDECAQLAIETLKQAVAVGLPKSVDVRKSAAFATLSQTAAFREVFGD